MRSREAPRRISVVSTASACGKTTLGRAIAAAIDAPFVELDALVHGPNWKEATDGALRESLEPILARERWVVDGNYHQKLGDLVIGSADLVVWLDLPIGIWFPRLVRRTLRRGLTGETLWNGNRESLKGAVWGADSLFGYALRTHRSRRREWQKTLLPHPHVRLSSPSDVDAFRQRFVARGGQVRPES